MPGSAENPVRIGPFKRIVEVGWPARWYAFRVALIEESQTADVTPCAPPDGPDNGDATVFVTSTSMDVTIATAVRYVGDTWEPFTGTLTFDNEPEGPFTNNFGAGEVNDVYTAEGPHRFALATGGGSIEDAPPPPGFPAEAFSSDADVGYEVIGQPLDPGSSYCGDFIVDLIQYAPTGPYGAVTAFASLGIDAIVLHHNGRQYTPVGAFLAPNIKGANPTVEISAPISAWVLCQRSDVTA